MFRNRWVRGSAIRLVLRFMLGGRDIFYLRHSTRREGNERLATIVAHLDETDPRWRLDDMEADRKPLNDDQNSALLVPRFKAALAKREFVPVRSEATKQGVFVDVPPNHVLDDEGAAASMPRWKGTTRPWPSPGRSRTTRAGLRRVTPITPDVIGTLLPALAVDTTGLQSRSTRRPNDSAATAGRGPPLELVQAMLNAARSIDGEPFLISCLVRYWLRQQSP